MKGNAQVLVMALLALVAFGCGTNPTPSATRLSVVTTTTVLADLVRQVGGERVAVHALVPKGGEVHTFDPAPSDAVSMSRADLLVMNGLGLDDWLLTFAEQASTADVPVLRLAENLTEVQYLHSVGVDESSPYNPHLWMNPQYARLYADQIRIALIEVDQAGQSSYDANADAYDDRLTALDQWALDEFSAIPESRRRVASFHDAFSYFTAHYGLELSGVITETPGQEPSAADLARLINAIRLTASRTILSEVQFSDELVRTIAQETGATIVANLYTDTLGDPPADTYEGALRWDVEQVVAALR